MPSEPTSCPPGEPGTFTAEQVYGALAALGRAPVLDPDAQPAGPADADIPTMLGALLAAVEQAVLLQASDQPQRLYAAYHETAPSNGWLAMLWNRLARTETELNSIVGSPLIDAGESALRAAVRMLQLAMRAELVRDGQPAGAEDDATVRRAIKEGRQAMTDARQQFEQVRKKLVALGYQV